MGGGRPYTNTALTWPFAITAAVAQGVLSGFAPLPLLCGVHGGVVVAAILQTLTNLPTAPPTLVSTALTVAAVAASSEPFAAAAVVLVAAAGAWH